MNPQVSSDSLFCRLSDGWWRSTFPPLTSPVELSQNLWSVHAWLLFTSSGWRMKCSYSTHTLASYKRSQLSWLQTLLPLGGTQAYMVCDLRVLWSTSITDSIRMKPKDHTRSFMTRAILSLSHELQWPYKAPLMSLLIYWATNVLGNYLKFTRAISNCNKRSHPMSG